MTIPEEIIEQVRDAADLVGVIGEHVELRRTGADYRGPCPFHGGTHRNFAVIPKKQMYYCFVCHEGGDVFTFFMKRLGMDYPTAVRDVARRVGITIPERGPAGPDPREPLYSAVGVAHEWYQEQLRDAADAAAARKYIEGRSLDLENMLPYGLGWAGEGAAFLAAMRKLGIADDTLVGAGLAVRKDDGEVRARFWQRLLFPIHDLRGRVVGFGGRRLDDGEPKYLNSPESEIFHKGRLLYNLHAAKHAIRRAEQAIVVEGYFDVLRLLECGMEHVVAPLGTGFTAEQAQLLKRVTQRVVLLFDSDAAGLRATFRTADELLRAGLRVTVATMPEGEDPDTLAQRGGAKAVEKVLRDAIDVFERKLQLLERKGWLASLAGRRKALDRLLPTLKATADPITRDLYLGRVTETLGVSRESVVRELERLRVHPQLSQSVGREPEPVSSPARGGPERDLVRVLLYEPEWRRRVLPLLPERSVLREPDRTILEALAGLPEGFAPGTLLETLDGEARITLAQMVEQPWDGREADAVAAAAIDRLQSRKLEREVQDLNRRIPLADETDKPALMRQKDVLSREIAKLNPGRWNVINRGRTSAR